jgi:hypothetical protein
MKQPVFFIVMIVLFMFSACAPPKDQEPVPSREADPAVATPSPTPTASGVLSMHYIDAASALAKDDIEKAKASLTALAKESTGELQTLAQAAANTGDIAAMRESFKALSAVATTMELPKDYAVAFCPMYKGGAKWVQKRETLANPYFGKTMATCGSFVN